MKLVDLGAQGISEKLKHKGLCIKVGPFVFSISSSISEVSTNILTTYGQFSIAADTDIVDFDICIDKPKGVRRWIKPQVSFYLDGKSPFLPLPASQAFPLLEWGMNWCIAQHSLKHLSLHAAVVEKNGCTIILPAQSGSGKSTLTAILVNNGWRLLSDEMALICLDTLTIQPLARPVSLKNESIKLIKGLYPAAIFSDVVDDTNKGTISHMRANSNAVLKADELASANYVVFPKFIAGTEAALTPKSKGESFLAVIENSFNYGILGEAGFDTLDRVIQQCRCFEFNYSATEQAITAFDQLAAAND